MKRIFVTFLAVLLLSFSAGSSYMEASQVEAVGPAVGAALSEEVLYEICMYVGSLVAVYMGGSLAANSDDASIARIGKAFIDSATIDGTDIQNAWFLATTDHVGQQYVFGSEALELVQDAAWQVIQGGAPDPDDDGGDDDNDNDDDNIIHIDFHQAVSQATYAGLAWIFDQTVELVQKWLDGDELTEAEASIFEALNDGVFSDYESIQNPDGTYHVTAYMGTNYPNGQYWEYIFDDNLSDAICVISDGHVNQYNPYGSFCFYRYDSKLQKFVNQAISCKHFRDGDLYYGEGYSTDSYFYGNWDTCYTNVPVFLSMEAALAAFAAEDFSSALNYGKTLRIADWPAEDPYWQGDGIVEATSANSLTYPQLLSLLRALGKLGNISSPSQYADIIGQVLPGVASELAPDVLPEIFPGLTPLELPDLSPNPALQPDPEKEPIYWPSPDAHPIEDPIPGADPNVKPTPMPDPDPEPQPLPGLDLDFDFDDAVSDVAGDFSGFGLSLKDKFPFCIPWDIYYLLTKLSEAPKTPVFKLPLYLPRYGIHEDIEIDLSPFESVSKLSRAFLSLLFAFGLIKMTISFVGMIDDNVTT